MAKLTNTTYRDSELVRFDAVKEGEIFVYEYVPYIKISEEFAVSLEDGGKVNFYTTSLVTYVKKAELKLTI